NVHRDEDIFGVNDQYDTSMFDDDKDLQGEEVVVKKKLLMNSGRGLNGMDNTLWDFFHFWSLCLLQINTASTSSSGTLPSNTVTNPKSNLKAITTRSGVSYDGPSIPPPVVENEPEATKNTVIPTNNGTTEDVQPQLVQSKPVTFEPANTPVSASKPNPQALIPYPSRRNDERNQEKAKDQIENSIKSLRI
nr:reverse transcriptase domain-containing protein [Tanacetum cinerariifolium]